MKSLKVEKISMIEKARILEKRGCRVDVYLLVIRDGKQKRCHNWGVIKGVDSKGFYLMGDKQGRIEFADLEMITSPPANDVVDDNGGEMISLGTIEPDGKFKNPDGTYKEQGEEK